MEKLLFTSESVTEGHPDKLCDAVSDAILDACIQQDPMSRVACETASCTGFILVTGEITTKAQLDIPAIVRKTALEIGYDDGKKGLDGNSCAVMVSIDKQSADIAMGVDKALEAKSGELTDDLDTGAGDQGMMFGYATNETEEYMPYPIALAHKLAFQLTNVRKDGTLTYLRPDGKTQVSVEYDEAGKPVRLEAVVLSTQHDEDVTQEQIHEDIKKYVFDPILPKDMIDDETKFFINPTGRFVIGGPHGDAGLTGRKIIVDTYGGYARHGGGAFSGKDCTKVDRSAAYAARYVAKNLVAAGFADKCEIQLSYAIGVAQPTSIMVDTFGTGKLADDRIVEIVRENFDLRPAGIITAAGRKVQLSRYPGKRWQGRRHGRVGQRRAERLLQRGSVHHRHRRWRRHHRQRTAGARGALYRRRVQLCQHQRRGVGRPGPEHGLPVQHQQPAQMVPRPQGTAGGRPAGRTQLFCRRQRRGAGSLRGAAAVLPRGGGADLQPDRSAGCGKGSHRRRHQQAAPAAGKSAQRLRWTVRLPGGTGLHGGLAPLPDRALRLQQ